MALAVSHLRLRLHRQPRRSTTCADDLLRKLSSRVGSPAVLRPATLLSVLVAAGLSSACAPHSGTQTSAVSSPMPSASSAAPASNMTASSAPVLTIKSGVVLVDGKSVGELVPKQVKRVDALFEEMKVRGRNSNVPMKSRRYTLAVSGDLDAAQFKSVFQTAAFAGWPVAILDTSGGKVFLHALVPSPPNATEELSWPEQTLVLAVHANTVEVWRVPKEKHGEGMQLLNASQALAGRLGEDCDRAPCSPSILAAANDTPFRAMESALATLAKAAKTAPLDVQFRSTEPKPGEAPAVRVGSTSLSGRLPPEVIQKVVRDAYGRLRRCYEAGLARDANLEGKLVVRFVINREGKVGEVTVAQGTTMPDTAAIECMVKEYEALTFPPPDGGIVTVVYPIMFSPE